MALPVYLAMTASEMSSGSEIPKHPAWMACHFSPWSEVLTNIPHSLPEGAMLILNDRYPCQGHSPGVVARQLADAVQKLACDSVLLDFQRPPEPESRAMVKNITEALSCPVAVAEGFAGEADCPVFLSPAPLHLPMEAHLAPWSGRDIWLEAALCQEEIAVTPGGTACTPQFPPERLTGGFFDNTLLCHYRSNISPDEVRFTLFDTPESLLKKLSHAEALGVTRAVGLYQELGT